MIAIKKIIREPLLHFLAIGGLIFVFYGAVFEENEIDSYHIEVTEKDLLELKKEFFRTWHRQPDANEMDNILENFVKSEIYYREALRLGFGAEDKVVRLRLRQKMEYLAENEFLLKEADSASLRNFYENNKHKYETPERYSFFQVFLGEDPSQELIDKVLSSPRDNTENYLSEFEVPSMLPKSINAAAADEISNRFGVEFSAETKNIKMGKWSGPVSSAFGKHLVLIKERIPSREEDFLVVKAKVERDYRNYQMALARESFYKRLSEFYQVSIPVGSP